VLTRRTLAISTRIPRLASLAVWTLLLWGLAAPAQAGDAVQTTVPFATNRDYVGGDDPEQVYGNERGSLSFGSCTVRFSPIPGMAALTEKLPFYVPNALQKVIAAQPMQPKHFWDQMSAAAAHGKRLLVFIHGYNYSFEKSCRRSASLQRALGSDVDVLLFGWPSEGNLASYTRDEADINWSVKALTQMLQDLVDRLGPGRVQLLAHSVGARGTVEALARLRCHEQGPALFDQLVLVAPDVDTGVFLEQLPALVKVVRHITLYASEHDGPLKLSREIHGYPRLGEAGERLTVAAGMDTVDVSLTGVYEVTGHRYHLYNPIVVQDIVRLLRRDEPAGRRPGLHSTQRGALTYWELLPPASDETPPQPPVVPGAPD